MYIELWVIHQLACNLAQLDLSASLYAMKDIISSG